MEFRPWSDRAADLRSQTAEQETTLHAAAGHKEKGPFEWRPSPRGRLTGDAGAWRGSSPRPIDLERRAKFARMDFQPR